MAISTRTGWLVLAAALQLGAAACSTLDRLPAVPLAVSAKATPMPAPIRYLVARETESFAAEAARTIAKEQAYLASRGHVGPPPPPYFLAISGGGDNGANGAGVLNAGRRPAAGRKSRS